MGATGFGYDVARQFGLRRHRDAAGARAADLRAGPAGAARRRWPASRSMRVAACGKTRIRRGHAVHPSGPVRPGHPADLVLLARGRGDRARHAAGRSTCSRRCARPARENGRQALQHRARRCTCPSASRSSIAERARPPPATSRICPTRLLRDVAEAVNDWRFKPAGSEGYRTAEVTLGGVDTRDLDSRTMAARDGAGPVFHRRGGGRHRLARRLQFPMGVVVRLVRRAGCLKANRLFPPPCGEG